MANLEQLRQKVKNITDYSPDLSQFNDQLDDLINDAYYSIWTMKRWNFATKLSTLRFHVDITPSSHTSTETTLSVTKGSRLVTLSAGIEALDFYKHKWEGQPIEIENMEYTISKIESTTVIILDVPYQQDTDSSTKAWKIKKRWYDLPEDCLELLYVGHRDYPYVSATGTQNPYGKSTGLMARREEDLNLRTDYEMDYAEAYITSPTQFTKPGENINISTISTSGANFQSGNFYEFCYAFVRNGKVGALSEPAVIEVENNNYGIVVKFRSWDDTAIAALVKSSYQQPDNYEGYRKVVLWNMNFDRVSAERTGLACWVYVVNGTNTTENNINSSRYIQRVEVEDTASQLVIKKTDQLNNLAERYIEIDGQFQQIRPYPRVNGYDFEQESANDAYSNLVQPKDFVREGVIRYLVKPQPMTLKTDTPNMPYEFHQLIVYKALEDIYLKLGQQSLATTYERKYTKEVANLAKRYVDKIDQQVRRGQFAMGRAPAVYDGSTFRKLS
jgi:hypothetical protein